MREKILLCTLFLIVAVPAIAQQHLVDSIAKELRGKLSDSTRAISMMRLAVDYEGVDTAKAFKAYNEAIEFARGKQLFYQLGRIYQNRSFLYMTAARYPDAMKGLDTAISSYERSSHPNARLWTANAYSDFANALKVQNDFQAAARYYLKSVSLLESMGLNEKLVTSYSNISTLFGDMGEHAKQTEYAYKAVDAARKSNSNQYLFTSYFILANAYSTQDNNVSAKVFLDSSTAHFDENEYVDNIDLLFSYYLVSAQVFKKLGKLDSAFYFFKRGFDVSRKSNYGYGKAESQLQMGAVALMQAKYPEAEKFLLAGIAEAEAIKYFVILNEGYKYLSDVYAVTGRYRQAYESYQKYKDVNDSVTSMESKKYVTELEKKYETEKKDKQITLQKGQLQQRKILNYIFIGSAAMLLIVSLLLYRNYRQKQRLQLHRIGELEKERQFTATEAVLKGEEQERSRLAKDLHDGLGGMMSGIKYSLQTMKQNLIMTPENQQAFERSMDMLDSSINEMRRVAHNMMPEALVKFGLDTALKDYCNDINASDALQVSYQSVGVGDVAIEQTIAITIYRIVQELINNIMKHASAKSAIVQVIKTNGSITITVEDDGKGFDPVILQGAKGIGWSNIQSRIGYLKGKADVQSGAGKGTSVHIELSV